MSVVRRRAFLFVGTLLVAVVAGCSHPAVEALQGHWTGRSVENFDQEKVAAATGWARGTSFVFRGNRIKVTVPAEQPRSGVFQLTAIEDRQVSLLVLDSRGEESELDLIVDDADSLRWVLGDGRTMVLERDR